VKKSKKKLIKVRFNLASEARLGVFHFSINCLETKCWYVNGLLHRRGGPAFIQPDGSRFWCIRGNLHRTDGPAVEWADGLRNWYLKGEFLGEADVGFWNLWDRLTDEQRNNTDLLCHLPGAR